jgi:hypothetical protein
MHACGARGMQVRSVADALDGYTAGEPVYGYKPDAHSAPVTATKTVKLQRLPPVLVLHLMRFEFGHSGSAKVCQPHCSCWSELLAGAIKMDELSQQALCWAGCSAL